MDSRRQDHLLGIQNPAGPCGAKNSEQGGRFALVAALVALMAVVGLSSCVGLTSADKPGGGTSGAGNLTPSAKTLTFGNVSVGKTATQTLTFTNTGTGTVNISSAHISGAGFSAIGGSPLSAIAVG